MEYIALIGELRLELAAEYLVMAAMLAEIKSRMLLPRPSEGEDEDDPRAELVRRLQEYERYKQAAADLDALPRLERELFTAHARPPETRRRKALPDVTLKELLLAFHEVVQRAELFTHHSVQREALSVRERMSRVLNLVTASAGFVEFHRLFDAAEGRLGVVVSFLAVLELLREHLLEIVQAEPFAPLYLKAPDAPESPVAETAEGID